LIKTEIKKISLFGRNNVKVFSNRPSSVIDFVKKTVTRYGEKEVLFLGNDKLTYKELDSASDRLIASFQNKYKIQKGDRIACLIGNSLEFAIVALACIKSGSVMIPISIKLKTSEVSYILSDSKPKIVIADQEFLPIIEVFNKENKDTLPFAKSIISIGEPLFGSTSLSTLLKEHHNPQEEEIEETDPIFILYTSGTTGHPKGAIISHINVVHTVMHFQRTLRSNHETRTILAIPFYHVAGLISNFLQMVYIGGSMVILNRFQNEEYIKKSCDFQVNFHFSITTIYQMMATSPLLKEYSFDNVKIVGFGGTPTSIQTLNMLKGVFPNASFHNVYGATETTAPSAISPINYPLSKAASVGKLVETSEIKIVDDSGNELGVNEVGELLIKGPMVIREYWDDPRANATSFVDGFWCSGDIGKIDEDGFVYILDRKKDMINRGGEKVFSVEVEEVLKKHPEIVEAAVVGIPDELYGERVKAFIVSNTLNEEDLGAIRSYCTENLAKYKIPEFFELTKELPRNASGKIMKHLLRKDLLL
jgi:long-chain acyl-CoA synthetase